jgi:hypothetical protein
MVEELSSDYFEDVIPLDLRVHQVLLVIALSRYLVIPTVKEIENSPFDIVTCTTCNCYCKYIAT